MALVKVIEVMAQSPKDFTEACQDAISQASKTVRNIKSFWVKEIVVEVDNNRVTQYRVTGKLSFLIDEK